MTTSRGKLAAGAIAAVAVAGAVYLYSSSLPSCSGSDITLTLEELIRERMVTQPNYAWLKPLTMLPTSTSDGEPLLVNITNHREGKSDAKVRHCAADLTLDVNNGWVDRKLKQLSDQSGSEQEKKIAVGIVVYSRAASQASGSKLQIPFGYAVQRTDAGDVYVAIE